MTPIKLTFRHLGDTKTCHKFETGAKPDQMTLYLKKAVLDAAGIDPTKGVTVTVEEA
jgi:hypothetical protein